MPAQQPNRLLRVFVPLIFFGLGLIVIAAFFRNSSSQAPAPSSAQTPSQEVQNEKGNEPARAAEGQEVVAAIASSSEDQAADEQAFSEAQPPATETAIDPEQKKPALRARVVTGDPVASSIGGLDVGQGPMFQITFSPQGGAGIESIALSDYFDTVNDAIAAKHGSVALEDHYRVQKREVVQGAAGARSLSSLAARAIKVNGTTIDLYGSSTSPLWREVSPGSFEAVIVNEADEPVLTIRRAYEIDDHSFDIRVRQSIENHSNEALEIVWIQYGPMNLAPINRDIALRPGRLRFGYLLDAQRDPGQTIVMADDRLTSIKDALKYAVQDVPLWPNTVRYKGSGELVWAAQTNRYFAFAIHSVFDPGSTGASKALRLAESMVYGRALGSNPDDQNLILEMHSEPLSVQARGTLELDFGAYAGPLGKKVLSGRVRAGVTDPHAPLYEAIALPEMVEYTLGGPCAICTFQWLAHFLLSVLLFFHDVLVKDWALAIILLVFCVRAVLHPVTKRSQIGLMRFTRKMQSVAPKQKKIQEKYKDDPKRMQQEMVKLMREEGVNYAGALGCLPMFLQTPIWIALYAMLYFAFELRHHPAFFGLFQSVTGGKWTFLADLSTSDHFIDFGRVLVTIPLLGSISGFNILPIVLGVVFFVQQKYLTPPPSTALSPEQEMQQKMMKVMMVLLFPLMIYNAPSGLVIYFITNSTLGILESRWIRAHVDKLELEPKNKPQHGALGQTAVDAAGVNPFQKKQRSKDRFKDRQ